MSPALRETCIHSLLFFASAAITTVWLHAPRARRTGDDRGGARDVRDAAFPQRERPAHRRHGVERVGDPRQRRPAVLRTTGRTAAAGLQEEDTPAWPGRPAHRAARTDARGHRIVVAPRRAREPRQLRVEVTTMRRLADARRSRRPHLGARCAHTSASAPRPRMAQDEAALDAAQLDAAPFDAIQLGAVQWRDRASERRDQLNAPPRCARTSRRRASRCHTAPACVSAAPPASAARAATPATPRRRCRAARAHADVERRGAPTGLARQAYLLERAGEAGARAPARRVTRRSAGQRREGQAAGFRRLARHEHDG